MRASGAALVTVLSASTLLAFALPARAADVVSPAAERVAIVVYPGGDVTSTEPDLTSGLVMVTERRTVDLPAGPSKISFRGVAEGIIPQTVAVQGLPASVAEQNFDYQLLTQGSLMRQSQGRMVTLARTNSATGKTTSERARVVSSENGVILDIAGRLEALKCSALPEKLVFDDLPSGLIDKPTLSLETVAPKAGRYTLSLSYLAGGVAWSANYVARINPDGKTLNLKAWITIGNHSATSFPNAPVQVLAGRVERDEDETRPEEIEPEQFNPNCWAIRSGRNRILVELAAGGYFGDDDAIGGVEEIVVTASLRKASMEGAPVAVSREDLGDYKLYTLPEPTTLAAYQTKQLTLFDRPAVAFKPVYQLRFDSSGLDESAAEPQPTRQTARLDNKTASGLGLPLPAGSYQVFDSAPSHAVLRDEDHLNDTPIGLLVELSLGASVGVTASIKEVVNSKDDATALEITLTNATARAAAVEVIDLNRSDGFKIVRESRRHTLAHGGATWTVSVPANGTTVLRYSYTAD